jgi:hypothetical protein
MCMNSLRTGKCLSQHCRYRHIKGTARHEGWGTQRQPNKSSTHRTHPTNTR